MNMATAAAGNRTLPNQPAPNSGNLHSCPNSNASTCGQQDSGAPMSSQDTAPPPHPQQHFSTRPVFYVPAPPPPPFLPFQWPVPFSYNPFGGFPGSKGFFPHTHLFVSSLKGIILSWYQKRLGRLRCGSFNIQVEHVQI